MKNTLYIIVSLCFFAIQNCVAVNKNEENKTGYNLNKPNLKTELPDTLREISGLTNIDSNTFACVQDENGILFFYNFFKNKIIHQYHFNMDGDYEGITHVGNSIFILRSDGTLFEISDYQSPNFKLHNYATKIPANDNEGLCYDANNHRLLIASKGKINKGANFKDKRVIYSFDLQTKTLSKNPIYEFDVQKIKQFAIDNKIKIPTKSKKNGQVSEPLIKMMTSAIAVHPINNKLYVLSAADHLFFVFDNHGNLENIEPLNPSIFNKAEGITFLDNGDMLITNEGQNNKPTLLRFNFIKK